MYVCFLYYIVYVEYLDIFIIILRSQNMKKRTFLISSIACLALSIGSVASVLIYKNTNNFTRATTDVEGSVTFSNNGHNVTEYAPESGNEGVYDYVTHANLHDGGDLYMRVYDSKKITGDDRIGNLYCSGAEVTVGDTDTSPFHFQDITSISFQVDCARDFQIRTSYDGVDYNTQNVSSDDSGAAVLVLGGVNYLQLLYLSFMDVPLYSFTVNYSCSYDYVDSKETVTIIATNDFHGIIEANGDETGIEAYATYIKNAGNHPNTLVLDQGDSWQGSIYSNTNRGNLVNDVMIEAGVDARTVGNHDFDWDLPAIKANTARVYKGQTLTTLAANVYDYNFNTKTFGENQQSDIGAKTATFTLDNGLKVGVVGVIGSSQITSINTLFVKNIGFKPHVQVIKDEATALRAAGCDIVIASCHTGEEEVKGQGLENYVDLVLCAHTHKFETSYRNGIWYGQFGSNGRGLGKIEFVYDRNQHKVLSSYLYTIGSDEITSSISEIDPTIHQLVQDSIDNCPEDADEVVANAVGFPDNNVVNTVWVDTSEGTGLRYYTYNGTTWNYTGSVVRPADLNNYYWYYYDTASWPADGINGRYYINTDTGNYYIYENGDYTLLGCVLGSNDPATTDWYISNSYFKKSSSNASYNAEDLMAQAMYDTAYDEGYTDIICSYVNYARADIIPDPITHEITYADLFKAFPFDNAVHIIECTGREIYNEVKKYNYARFSDAFIASGKQIDLNQKYKIATLDYLAFHTDDDREYDYFDENSGNYLGTLTGNYRMILKNWLHDKGYDAGRSLYPYDYWYTNTKFNRNEITVTNTFTVTFMMNDGTATAYQTISNVSYGAYIPSVSNPSRSGYEFTGWYLDSGCTRPVSGSYTILNNLTVYAGWVEADDNLYSAHLTCDGCVADTLSTNVTASNSSSDTVQMTISHSAMQIETGFDTPEFGVANNGYFLISAPSGYRIKEIELQIYNTYDNFNFYNGTSTDDPQLPESRTSANKKTTYSLSGLESDNVYIKSNYVNTVWLYYLDVTLEKIS